MADINHGVLFPRCGYHPTSQGGCAGLALVLTHQETPETGSCIGFFTFQEQWSWSRGGEVAQRGRAGEGQGFQTQTFGDVSDNSGNFVLPALCNSSDGRLLWKPEIFSICIDQDFGGHVF